MKESETPLPRHLAFEGFELDTVRRELRDPHGEVVALPSKAFDVLCALIAQRTQVLDRDALLAAAWPGRIVEENNLTQAIATLRRAFGADGHDRRFILTVPGRGYRFIAGIDEPPPAVAHDGSAAAAAARPTEAPATPRGAAAAIPRLAGRGWRGRHALLEVLLVGLAALLAWPEFQRQADAPQPAPVVATLAVLPFRVLGQPPEQAHASGLGLADALVRRLERTGGLHVRALDSIQRLGPDAQDPVLAGRHLGASHVLLGTVDFTRTPSRVSLQLLPVAGGSTRWSTRVDLPNAGWGAAQDALAAAVGKALAVSAQSARRPLQAPCEGDDPAAFAAVLRARYRLHQREMSAPQAWQRAIDLDPTCARAYAGLANALLSLAHQDRRPADVFPLARAAALQALRIDPESAEGWAARGRQLQLDEWDWDAAERALRRALALNPGLADAHFGLAHLLVTTGRFDQGLAQVRIAREADPLSPMFNALEAGFLGAAGQPAPARARLEVALRLKPDFWVARQIAAGMAIDAGQVAAARRDAIAALASSGNASQVVAVAAAADAAAGDIAAARVRLSGLEQRARTAWLPPTSIAAARLAVGDADGALDALEQAERDRDIRLVFLGVDARWNPLRKTPRFIALAQRMQLSAAPARGRF